MIGQKTLVSLVFAAGATAGGGGAYQTQQVALDEATATIEQKEKALALAEDRIKALKGEGTLRYLAAGIVDAYVRECMDQECRDIRRYQWGLILEDLKPDVEPTDTFTFDTMALYVSERITYGTSEAKEVWLQDALDAINDRLAEGYAAKEITPDDVVTGPALIAMLEAARA